MSDDVQKQKEILKKQYSICEGLMSKYVDSSDRCNTSWTGLVCWPSTLAGEESIIPCPMYVTQFNNEKGYLKRTCSVNGTWLPEHFDILSTCIKKSKIEKYLKIMDFIAQLGYSMSLVALIFAFIILLSFTKLRCSRNELHLNLFFSFILRSILCLLKDNLLADGFLGFIWTITDEHKFGKPTWGCKMLISIWQYALTANYSWILIEGLYLHNLIFLGFVNERKGTRFYCLLGWGLPTPFWICWILVRAFVDDKYCWTAYYDSNLEWILRAPITASIIINFVFYVMVVVVLFSRLNVSACQNFMGNKLRYSRNEYRMKKWITSTLILIPLFGTYYIIFLFMSFFSGDENTVPFAVWLFCDTFATSFQGLIVAILYCFMNMEVQKELKKKWRWLRMSCSTRRYKKSSLTKSSYKLKSCPDKKEWFCSSRGTNQLEFTNTRL